MPDTGIPSIQTLIEYKFLGKKHDEKLLADQILADTRGYHSKDWNHFFYVIYETGRFCPEKKWNQLLRACDVPDSTTIIVLSGERTVKKRIQRSKHSKK